MHLFDVIMIPQRQPRVQFIGLRKPPYDTEPKRTLYPQASSG